MRLEYVKGDATLPIGEGNKCIVHCCNSISAWGSGFVISLSKRWKLPEQRYLQWGAEYEDGSKEYKGMPLGQIQVVQVEKDIAVINLIGQNGCGIKEIAGVKIPPVDYRAFLEGFARIKQVWLNATKKGKTFSLHMPRMGTDRAGGSWSRVAEILEEVFSDTDIEIYVYDLPEGMKK